jgi:hypothetical protein
VSLLSEQPDRNNDAEQAELDEEFGRQILSAHEAAIHEVVESDPTFAAQFLGAFWFRTYAAAGIYAGLRLVLDNPELSDAKKTEVIVEAEHTITRMIASDPEQVRPIVDISERYLRDVVPVIARHVLREAGPEGVSRMLSIAGQHVAGSVSPYFEQLTEAVGAEELDTSPEALLAQLQDGEMFVQHMKDQALGPELTIKDAATLVDLTPRALYQRVYRAEQRGEETPFYNAEEVGYGKLKVRQGELMEWTRSWTGKRKPRGRK